MAKKDDAFPFPRLSVPQIKAVSIETAFQNGGIAFILLKVSLPPPYGDLATVAPVAQLVITGLGVMGGSQRFAPLCT